VKQGYEGITIALVMLLIALTIVALIKLAF
jgi:hypothetical protein